MTWAQFKAAVDELLAVERRRLGVQPAIDRQVRLAVGDIQRLIPYYRTGITSTFEHDDLAPDGFASKGVLPDGILIREKYHVRTGSTWVRRPLHAYSYSNRHDLRVGVANARHSFLMAIDPRMRNFWVYPKITPGYAVQVVWDAVVGRSQDSHEFKDTDRVPFDEPCVNLVYLWVKAFLAREVDRNLQLMQSFQVSYRSAMSSLYSETEERRRSIMADSEATCLPGDLYENGYPCACPDVVVPQTEWVMFGDSGDRSTINDTIAVATAVRALDPQFVVHLGDCAYGTTQRPGDVGSTIPVGTSTGGAAHLLQDLLLQHYWGFLDGNFYLSFGNHDLETGYGLPLLNALRTTRTLIGEPNKNASRLWYEFARGPVRFFVLNLGLNDADPLIQMTEQRDWLLNRIGVAAEPWLVVVAHRPAYTSDVNHHPGSTMMRSLANQLRAAGVDLVVSAHAHSYERILDASSLQHVVCGLGGAPRRGTANPINLVGSQFFYNGKPGFLHFKADTETLQWELRTVDNEVVDRLMLRKVNETVTCVAPVIMTQPANSTVTETYSRTLTVVAEGNAPLVYQWFKDGVALSGKTSASLTISSAQMSDAGEYWVTVTNPCGTVESSHATLEVYEQPEFTVYYGKSTAPLADEAAILALQSRTATNVVGTFSVAAGPGYFYYAVASFAGDAFNKPASMMLGAFPLSLAGLADGYGSQKNSLPCRLVTINGIVHRVYRSFNTMNGAIDIVVN